MKTTSARRLDALTYARHCSFLRTFPNKPGVVIQSLPEEVREQLKRLKSDDLQNERVEF